MIMCEHKVLPVSVLVSDEVESEDGRKLGTIQEFMIDVDQGRIAYAIISVGGLFGFGRKLVAVPWNAFTQRDRMGALHLSREVLEKAPVVDIDNWALQDDGEPSPSITAEPARQAGRPN